MMYTLPQIVEILRDGKEYDFWTDGLNGVFHKAPFPSQERHNERDGALSAITFREGSTGKMVSPVLLLHEFTEPVWHLRKLK